MFIVHVFQIQFVWVNHWKHVSVQGLSFIFLSCTLHVISILNPALSESSFVYIICEGSETAQICV